MTEQDSIESRLARIEEHLKSIDKHLERQLICRHVIADGECDFYQTIIEHDRLLSKWGPDIKKIDEHDKRINQWTGALAAVSLLCAFIGSVIGVVLSKILK